LISKEFLKKWFFNQIGGTKVSLVSPWVTSYQTYEEIRQKRETQNVQGFEQGQNGQGGRGGRGAGDMLRARMKERRGEVIKWIIKYLRNNPTRIIHI